MCSHERYIPDRAPFIEDMPVRCIPDVIEPDEPCHEASPDQQGQPSAKGATTRPKPDAH